MIFCALRTKMQSLATNPIFRIKIIFPPATTENKNDQQKMLFTRIIDFITTGFLGGINSLVI